MKFNSLFKTFLFALTLIMVISCDKDFNEIGADFVDDDHYEFTAQKYDVLAHNQKLGPVQTNNLPVNPLGYFTNNVFGKTKASFVTQLELASVDPKFYDVTSVNAIDSVYLYVPYFARAETANEDGTTTYKPLDSLFGNPDGKIRLSVFKSNYFLRNLDPDTGLTEQQRYYSNQSADFNAYVDGTRLNNSSETAQNDDFQFKNTQIKFLKTDPATGQPLSPPEIRELLAPGLYMDLRKDIFYSNIFNAPAGKLETNNAFKEYFRGLYFKVDDHGDNTNHAALAMLNFAQGRIVIVYKDNKSSTDATKVRKTLTLNLRGNSVSLLENNYSPDYATALTNANTTTGDTKLFVKGGEGSGAIISLFGGAANASSIDLNKMRDEKWIINEANLVFNIDNESAEGMGLISGDEDIKRQYPKRVYLYDYNNRRPLIDYYFDTTTSADAKFNKLSHSGILVKASATSRGTRYKVRITNHLRNLVKYKDSTNIKLGLVVTENIGTVTSYKALNPSPFTGDNAKFVPAASVMNPLGTVLYGSHNSVPADKRLQLEIIYTKPDPN